MPFVIKPMTREGCASERMHQPLYTETPFEVVFWGGFFVWTLFPQLDRPNNWLFDFSPAALLLATSPSSRVCKSLYIWKHRQQGVIARDHRRIRWAGWGGGIFGCHVVSLSSLSSEGFPSKKTELLWKLFLNFSLRLINQPPPGVQMCCLQTPYWSLSWF